MNWRSVIWFNPDDADFVWGEIVATTENEARSVVLKFKKCDGIAALTHLYNESDRDDRLGCYRPYDRV
jgi:hypothetical protein